MDHTYYDDARKWYNTMYVNGASERILYFFLSILVSLCLYFSYDIFKVLSKQKQKVNTYIMLMEHKDPDSMLLSTQMPEAKDQELSLIELLIRRYVVNLESLTYDTKEQTSADAFQDKTHIIQNLSSKDVFENYMKEAHNGDESDMSLVLLKQQKTATIEKIKFLYDETKITDKIYSMVSSSILPHGAIVYFSTETTSETSSKKRYKATLSFSYYVDSEKKANSRIEFKVNDYYKELID